MLGVPGRLPHDLVGTSGYGLKPPSLQGMEQVGIEGWNALHEAANAGCSREELELQLAAGWGLDCQDAEGNTALHLASREEYPATCRALAELGADALIRNSKGKTPRMQPGLSAEVREVLLDAEEASKKRRAEKQSKLWDEKMLATQTASACRLGCV